MSHANLPARLLLVASVLASSAAAQVTTRASLAHGGGQAGGQSWHPAISGDGRHVAFASHAADLVPTDTNGLQDIFVHDRVLGTNELVSVGSAGEQANGNSHYPAITPDGRFVAFVSEATNLVAPDGNIWMDVFVRDRVLGTTQRIDVGPQAQPADGQCFRPSVSADGRYVVFASAATNLVAGDTNGAIDVFLRDRLVGATSRVSLTPGGGQGNGASDYAVISADGRCVAFSSAATNLVPGDINGAWDVFVHDRQTGQTVRASVGPTGAGAGSDCTDPALSGDGRFVAFLSRAPDLVPADTNGSIDVFVRDLLLGATSRESVRSDGAQADFDCVAPLSLSADGQSVSFPSWATNLVEGDTNDSVDSFVHDRASGRTFRVSVDSDGAQALGSPSGGPCISADGRYVAFGSWAANLVEGDTNGTSDVFVRDLCASGFELTCEPGTMGTLACPCANPPAGSGQGCDNSTGSGGASLAAAGAAYLSADSLIFTTSHEPDGALSLLLQGDAELAAGVSFGQGVRCVGGSLERLYAGVAVGGGLALPDRAGGDSAVSARSAALGDAIAPGESRWYFVAYRDPGVPPACAALGGFNATPSGRVTWSL